MTQNGSRPWQAARGVPKVEENIRAAKALVEALGVKTPQKPRNWTVCHIWGYDDENYRSPKRPRTLYLRTVHVGILT